MNDDEPVYHQCEAGRRATFAGRWTIPCLKWGNEALAFSEAIGGDRAMGTPILYLCSEHIGELIAGGLVDEVAVEPDEWDDRTGRRTTR